MPAFVIEYNRRTRERRVTEYSTPKEAMKRRLELESTQAREEIEIVALSCASLDVLEQTHSRYFAGEEITP